MKARLRSALAERTAAGLYRNRRVLDGPQGPVVHRDGRELLAFCSNDYLGLANHPEVVRALRDGAARWGAGAGAAHLVCGHMTPHHALEQELADFVGRPRALLFSTGYMANLGTVAALTRRGDPVYEDRLNHASLLDAARLAAARLVRYRHADGDDLAAHMRRGPGLVVTDGVFSMDGDLAPLPTLAAATRAADGLLMVDDAHGLGVLGQRGRGTLEYFGLGDDDVPVLVGTLGKAFGTFGAFVAGDDLMIESLIQFARPYIYTTAIPPAVAEATRVSLRLVDDEAWRRDALSERVRRFRAGAVQLGLELMDSETPIQPVMLHDADRALRFSTALEQAGILVTPIRPPTVPEGTARLRITFTADHSEAQVDRLLGALDDVLGTGMQEARP